MTRNEKEFSRLLIKLFGGKENLSSLTCCTTRLIMRPQDITIIKKHEIENMPEVLGIWEKHGEMQLLLVMDVYRIYKCIMKLIESSDALKMNSEKDEFNEISIYNKYNEPLRVPLIKKELIITPVEGEIVLPRAKTNTFVNSITISSSSRTLVAPVDGTIKAINYPDLSIEISSECGITICVHIYKENGESSEMFSKLKIRVGDQVSQGQILMHIADDEQFLVESNLVTTVIDAEHCLDIIHTDKHQIEIGGLLFVVLCDYLSVTLKRTGYI